MRDPHAPAWTKFTVFAAAVLFVAVGLTSRAAAQAKFDRLFVFGDSYADLTLSDSPASNPLAPPGLKLNLWRVYPVPLAKDLGIPGIITDVAVGGATADPKLGNPSSLIAPGIAPPPNLPEQVQAFLSTNPSFGSRNLVTINIGGNDIRDILTNTPAQNLALGYPASITPANAKEFADKTTEFATKQIGLLQDAGARNFILGGIQQHIRFARAARQSQRASSGRCRLHLQECRRLCKGLLRRFADTVGATRQRGGSLLHVRPRASWRQGQ